MTTSRKASASSAVTARPQPSFPGDFAFHLRLAVVARGCPGHAASTGLPLRTMLAQASLPDLTVLDKPVCGGIHRMEPLERILIIDDDRDLCALAGRFLAGEGFEAEFAHSGAEGVRKALAGEFSMILLDVMMPDLSGFEVLRRLRAESRTPVLMLTARGDTQDRVQGLEAGADDYLPKPFDPPELAARIR